MFAKTILALAALVGTATAFTTPSMAISLPRRGGRGPQVPAEAKPLTERLGGVGVSAPFPEGFGT